MIKTADLQRSKRLKKLGWEQESCFYWADTNGTTCILPWKNPLTDAPTVITICSAPTAGEMIEWLLGKNLAVIITKTTVSVGKEMERLERFLIKDGNICNALADACAWVIAKAIEGQEIK